MQDTTNVAYPYSRIVQWAAGPVSAAVGLGFGWLAVRCHVVIPPSVHNQVVLGASGAALSAVGAGVTYLAHHKWFSNLAHWFFANQDTTVVDGVPPLDEEPDDVEGALPAPAAPTPSS